MTYLKFDRDQKASIKLPNPAEISRLFPEMELFNTNKNNIKTKDPDS